MKLLFESWRKYLGEQKLIKVDWTGDPKRWPPGAREAFDKANSMIRKTRGNRRSLLKRQKMERQQLKDKNVGNEEKTKLALKHAKEVADFADQEIDLYGDDSVKALEIYHNAGFVPPASLVSFANEYRNFLLEPGFDRRSKEQVIDKTHELGKKAALSGEEQDFKQLMLHWLNYSDDVPEIRDIFVAYGEEYNKKRGQDQQVWRSDMYKLMRDREGEVQQTLDTQRAEHETKMKNIAIILDKEYAKYIMYLKSARRGERK